MLCNTMGHLNIGIKKTIYELDFKTDKMKHVFTKFCENDTLDLSY